jgi:hypothetical protein
MSIAAARAEGIEKAESQEFDHPVNLLFFLFAFDDPKHLIKILRRGFAELEAAGIR